MSQELQKLTDPVTCGLDQCSLPAHWQVLGSAQSPQVAACDVCVLLMADMNDDNETFFRPALDEIADRYEQNA